MIIEIDGKRVWPIPGESFGWGRYGIEKEDATSMTYIEEPWDQVSAKIRQKHTLRVRFEEREFTNIAFRYQQRVEKAIQNETKRDRAVRKELMESLEKMEKMEKIKKLQEENQDESDTTNRGISNRDRT